MNALLAKKIPRRAHLCLGCWALMLAFLLPRLALAVTDYANAADWAAKGVEVEQRLAMVMADVESAQAQLRRDPEAVKSQTRPTALP